MLTTDIKNFKRSDSVRNNLLGQSFLFPKNNIDNNRKKGINQPYNEYLNQNSLMNNQISSGEFTLSTTGRTRNNKEENNSNECTSLEKNLSQPNLIIKAQKQSIDNSFLHNLIFHKMEIKQYRNYIYHIQKQYNDKCGNYIKYSIKEDHNFNNEKYKKEINQLENLISRYSIIIFFLIKQKQRNIAKNILLLMIKENIVYIDFFEKNIFKEYNDIENNINLIIHGLPKSLLTLLKIYSFILKYSLFFNITKNRDIFLSRYLSLQRLNHKLFLLKNEMKGSFLIPKNRLKYIYSNCLFNACYFSIMFYCPLIIPIQLSELIFKLYEGINEFAFNQKEKSLILKSSFNYALYIYINGNSELALTQLEIIKQKLISFYEDDDNNNSEDDDDEGEDNATNNISSNNIKEIDPFKNFRKRRDPQKKMSVSLKDKYLIKKLEALSKLGRRRGFIKPKTTIDKIKEILFNIELDEQKFSSKKIFEPIQQTDLISYKNKIHKKTVKIEDIKRFFISDVKTILNKGNRKCSITERDIKNKQKFQNTFGVENRTKTKNDEIVESIVNLRASHINFRSMFKLNNLNLPKYMTNPLLIEAELLMCEIEIDSKNINRAYEHFKNSILILFISKQKENKNDQKAAKDFRKRLCRISIYLNEINKFIDEKNKKEKFQIVKCTIKKSKSYLTQNKKKIFSKKKLKEKKSSMKLRRNYLFESIEVNTDKEHNSKLKYDEYYNNLLNKKTAEEIEKFFLFLNSLSIYQLKLLNDTQPQREIRNDLPILFSGQFTDSLTSGQRDTLRSLHTMSISRNMMLNNPDKLILPSNLKFSALDYKDKKTNKNTSDKNHKLTKKINNYKKYYKVISLSNSKEYGYFKNIIFSKNIDKGLQQFFLDNYSLVMKILKESNQNDLEKIKENPDILVEPINDYKRNKSKTFSNNLSNYSLLKFKDMKDLQALLSKINNFKIETNVNNEKENNPLIDNESENNISLSISINNSSFNN